ncbi:hypothetical protein Y1Q_0001210 [Alligator mississippiensis]|uniref:Uncharacterized protein n=1 Tax=Alligator mississippiensis TaxID=8496 RepID=A0A151PEL7_ALLMI|nr:hypothetical protein Y1Q_0001210 [Alligator mississippiensis]
MWYLIIGTRLRETQDPTEFSGEAGYVKLAICKTLGLDDISPLAFGKYHQRSSIFQHHSPGGLFQLLFPKASTLTQAYVLLPDWQASRGFEAEG